MRVVFFGTPQFSAEILKDLVEKGLNIVAIVTQPDKLQGRKLRLQEPAVKKIAQANSFNIPIIQPEKIRQDTFYNMIKEYQADLFVVVAFGQIFPQKLLDMPRLGCINVHTSLLPKYRGAAPIERSIMEGETQTGVSIMYMVKELDAGDVLATKTVEICPNMNALDLTIKLCDASKDLLYPTIMKLNNGLIDALPQNHDEATYAKKVMPVDALIDWKKTAIEIRNQFRGVTPKPGAWCWVKLRDKILRVKLIDLSISMLKGKVAEILSYDQNGLIIGCKDEAIKITKLQVEGKKALSISDFIKGYSFKDVSFNAEPSAKLV